MCHSVRMQDLQVIAQKPQYFDCTLKYGARTGKRLGISVVVRVENDLVPRVVDGIDEVEVGEVCVAEVHPRNVEEPEHFSHERKVPEQVGPLQRI